MRIEVMNPNFTKYHNAVLHHFTGPDVGDPHDHPFDFTARVISGSYVEQVFTIYDDGTWKGTLAVRQLGDVFTVQAEHIHRIVILPQSECWTLVEYGPHRRETQFYSFGDRVLRRPWHQATFDE